MENANKIILDLCGGTGSWSKPYRDAGYDVRVITLPDYSVTNVVFSSDYMVFDKQTCDVNDMAVEYPKVYGILAAPPCTEFSLAKTTAPRDFHLGMEVVKGCMEIIWRCRLSGGLKFWCMENPRGFLRQFMGKPPYTFEQWEFGEPRIKPTDLWGYFNEPAKAVKERPADLTTKFPNGRINTVGWSRKTHLPEHEGLSIADIRAITPPGFAKAFYRANP